jgi:hypothetical protein
MNEKRGEGEGEARRRMKRQTRLGFVCGNTAIGKDS